MRHFACDQPQLRILCGVKNKRKEERRNRRATGRNTILRNDYFQGTR